MPDYQNGKVYIIHNDVNDLKYIGSTIQTLSTRMTKHRSDRHRLPYKFYTAMNEIGVEHFTIELLEDFPCERKEQLNKREGQLQRQYDTIKNGYNAMEAGRTLEEYRNEPEHKEHKKETDKLYRIKKKQTMTDEEKAKERQHQNELLKQRRQKSNSAIDKKYYQNHKEEIKQKYLNNQEKHKAYYKEKYANLTDEERAVRNEKKRQNYLKNHEARLEKARIYREAKKTS